ncbi:glycosyltransferase family protein [Paraconexibacter antarcticus]|uniref:Glycosyltransferase family protein n=1 Tax=Paraconexibacter antarcticus TaxID=2949664 RepID=A0ABY5DTV2_9ACTN|nr:glycosyltransferase [Paraconexibacter antarcticus]UTI64708.1 glycosyltransferase family protein [Paraconexibacter antarcticus]
MSEPTNGATMFVFATCVGSEDTYRAWALPGLRLAGEPDTVLVHATAEAGSIFTAYDEVLDAVCAMDGVEALVLIHEDVELLDPGFCATVRARLAATPDVAVIGAVGASDVRSLAWWEGRGAGRVAETRGVVDFGGHPCPVDTVDGLLMVLSPWAIANLRYGPGHPPGFHGYDAELCFAARAAGRSVWVEDLPLIHHTKGGYGDVAAYARADDAFRARWIAPGAAAVAGGGVSAAAR